MKTKIGLFLVNLGTPNSPKNSDVGKYLRQFLMDKRVIDIPFLNRFLLINGIIVPFRTPKSAKIYKELWDERGSPLKYYGEDVRDLLQTELGADYIVRLGMRYQNPDLTEVLEEFKYLGCQKIVLFPLFPQYASASSGSVIELFMEKISQWQVIPSVEIISSFFENEYFLNHFVETGKKYSDQEKYDHFLFTYHGLPERQILKGDSSKKYCELGNCCQTLTNQNYYCYRAQCFATTRLIVQKLGLEEGTYTTSFQSRLGKTPWIKPYSDEIIEELAKKGIKKILAFSPSFVTDCLETTIEIGEEYNELFQKHGGQKVQLVESLNNSKHWIPLIKSYLHTI